MNYWFREREREREGEEEVCVFVWFEVVGFWLWGVNINGGRGEWGVSG